jgi:hypothetical protein
MTMKFFYLSSKVNPKGQYEVHEKECSHLPGALDRDYLGPFNNGTEALRKAATIKTNAVCCDICCKPVPRGMFVSTKVDNS